MGTMTREDFDIADAEFPAASRRPFQSACRHKNVGPVERLGSVASGAVLGLMGLSRGRPLWAAVGAGLLYRGLTGHCAGYQAVGINRVQQAPATAVAAQQRCKVEKSITINRPADAIYRMWRDLSSLPQFMRHLKSVAALDEKRSRWIAHGPAGTELKWDAEIINERENELLAWRSLPGGDVDTAGSLHLEQLHQDRGTVATVSLKYNPPGGTIVAHLAEWFGVGLQSKLNEDLRRFKQLLETGEITTTTGQPSGRTAGHKVSA